MINAMDHIIIYQGRTDGRNKRCAGFCIPKLCWALLRSIETKRDNLNS